jgi:hypothetical protein
MLQRHEDTKVACSKKFRVSKTDFTTEILRGEGILWVSFLISEAFSLVNHYKNTEKS